MKKGFVFDLDGVITDTAKFHYIAWKAISVEKNEKQHIAAFRLYQC